MEDIKRCKGCEKEKPLSEFSNGRNKCKTCAMDYFREYCRTHPEYAAKQDKHLKELQSKIEEDPVRSEKFREKRIEYSRQYNKKMSRKYTLGISDREYQDLLEQQKGVCAICGKPETSKSQKGEVRSLAVDHCHTTNKTRGLLCFRCNTKLYVLEDENFRLAAEAYVASHKQSVD